MPDEHLLQIEHRVEWRRWLGANHNKYSAVWLVTFKKATGKPNISYDEAVEEAICYGWIDGKRKSIDDERHAYRFTPRKVDSKWSELNIRRAKQLLESGQMTEAGIAAFEGHETRKSPALPTQLPKKLQIIFESNQEAWNNFTRFPESYQKICIQWIASAKQESTQQRRLESVISHSALNRKVKFM